MYIIKKDGTKEPFNVQKVVAAVNKSAERVLYTFKPEELDFICRFVTEKCEALGTEGIMIAQMHNIVEGALECDQPCRRQEPTAITATTRQDFVQHARHGLQKDASRSCTSAIRKTPTRISALVSTKPQPDLQSAEQAALSEVLL